MLSPSASAAYDIAFARLSISASLSQNTGKTSSPVTSTHCAIVRRRCSHQGAAIGREAASPTSSAIPAPSAFVRGKPPQQAGGLEHEHEHQQPEDHAVRP